MAFLPDKEKRSGVPYVLLRAETLFRPYGSEPHGNPSPSGRLGGVSLPLKSKNARAAPLLARSQRRPSALTSQNLCDAGWSLHDILPAADDVDALLHRGCGGARVRRCEARTHVPTRNKPSLQVVDAFCATVLHIHDRNKVRIADRCFQGYQHSACLRMWMGGDAANKVYGG